MGSGEEDGGQWLNPKKILSLAEIINLLELEHLLRSSQIITIQTIMTKLCKRLSDYSAINSHIIGEF